MGPGGGRMMVVVVVVVDLERREEPMVDDGACAGVTNNGVSVASCFPPCWLLMVEGVDRQGGMWC